MISRCLNLCLLQIQMHSKKAEEEAKRKSNKCPRKSMCLLTHFNVWPKDWGHLYRHFFEKVSYYAKWIQKQLEINRKRLPDTKLGKVIYAYDFCPNFMFYKELLSSWKIKNFMIFYDTSFYQVLLTEFIFKNETIFYEIKEIL